MVLLARGSYYLVRLILFIIYRKPALCLRDGGGEEEEGGGRVRERERGSYTPFSLIFAYHVGRGTRGGMNVLSHGNETCLAGTNRMATIWG